MHKESKISLLALLGASVALGPLAMPAMAQESKEQADDQVLDTVVVTTERREQSVQDVAAVVKTISGEELRKKGINKFEDLSISIPQLNIGNREGNVEVFIRGIGDDNNTELSEPRSAILLDGVYLSRPRGLGSFFYDIQNVEVNLGPQGTVRGRNATGGSLNIIPQKPILGEFGGFLDAGFGNFSQLEITAAVNLPLGEKAAARVAGYFLRRDEVIDAVGDLAPTVAGDGTKDDKAVRISFLWEPTENFTANFSADFLDGRGTGSAGLNFFPLFSQSFVDAVADNGPFEFNEDAVQAAFSANLENGNLEDISDDLQFQRVARGTENSEIQQLWGFKADLVYDFGPFSVQYIGAYRDVDSIVDLNSTASLGNFDGFDENIIGTSSAPPSFVTGDRFEFFNNFSRVRFDQDFDSQSHEIRIFSDEDQRLSWTAGGFYFAEEGFSFFNSAVDRGFVFLGQEFAFPDTSRDNFAFYGDATFNVTEKFRVTGGVRYTNESLTRSGFFQQAQFLFPVDAAITTNPDGSANFNFSCCGFQRFGTQGFEVLGRNRELFEDDFDLTTAEGQIGLFLSGIGQFGNEDTVLDQINLLLSDGNNPEQGGFNLAARTTAFTIPNDSERTDDFVDFRARFEYDFTPDHLFFASISSGTNSGGFNDTAFGANGILLAPEFEPERLIAYEIGSKNQFEIGGYTTTLNLAAFFYDYSDQQFTVLAPLDMPDAVAGGMTGLQSGLVSLRLNAGDSELFGIDFDYTQELPWNLTARLNVQYLDTEFTSSAATLVDTRIDAQDPINFNPLPVTPADITGNVLPRASEWSGVFNLSQELDIGLGTFDWLLSIGFRSDYFLTIFNGDGTLPRSSDFPELFADGTGFEGLEDLFDINVASNSGSFTDSVDGFVRYDFGFGFEPKGYENVRFEFYGKNLSNVFVSQTALVTNGTNLRFTADPRTFGGRIRVTF